MTDEHESQPFVSWCLVEIMGHKKFAALVTEVEHFGKAWLRLDVYRGQEASPDRTMLYNPDSIYAIHPTTEELCRRYSSRPMPGPIERYEPPNLEDQWVRTGTASSGASYTPLKSSYGAPSDVLGRYDPDIDGEAEDDEQRPF